MKNSVMLYAFKSEIRVKSYVPLSCSVLNTPEIHYVIFASEMKPCRFTVPAMFPANSNSFTV